MAFDITPYVDMSPKKVRELIRKGVIDFPTAGMQMCIRDRYLLKESTPFNNILL